MEHWKAFSFSYILIFQRLQLNPFYMPLGQSFFSLAVGFSCMVTYSSYVKKDVSIPAICFSVVWLNIFVSLLAGLAIFPVPPLKKQKNPPKNKSFCVLIRTCWRSRIIINVLPTCLFTNPLGKYSFVCF